MSLKKLVVTLASFFALLNFTNGSIPSAPSLTIGEVGSRSINISWTRPSQGGNSSQLNYTVFYKASDKNVLQFVEVESVTKATLVVKPFKEYEIFAMAKNNDGYGPPSEKKRSTRTPEAVPESCPASNGLYVEESGNDLDVIITRPIPEEDHNGIITHYIIFFKSINMTTFKNITVNATKPNPDITFTLQNMSYAKSYGFKVAAVNSAGFCKGWQSLELFYEKPAPKTTLSPCAPATTVSPSTQPPPSTPAPTTTEAIVVPSTTPLIETTTSAPEEKTSPKSTDPVTEIPSPVGKLARTSESSWLIYILIALAVIVAIMGITIFLLIWQLYKNHRFYKLRKEQYKMNNTTPNIGTDNEAQDNPV